MSIISSQTHFSQPCYKKKLKMSYFQMEDLQMQLEDAEKRASEHWDLATEKDILYDKEVC